MFWQVSELALFLVFLAGLLAAAELAFRLGIRRADLSDESAVTHINILQTALLGLLALLLGFTFFMAVSRFDERRSLVLEEANAIGTTYLRSDFLPAEQRRPVKELLRAHVAARLAFHAAGVDPVRLQKANRNAAELERQLWTLAVAAAAQDPRSVPAGLFVESLNALIDIHEKRQAALDNHVPEAVIYLLLAVAGLALALIGYGCGLTRRRRLIANTLFTILIVFVITTILDIDRPRRGLITVSQQSLIRLQASMERDSQ